MALRPGDRVDRYEVVDLLGSGGMGEVYRARDPRLGRLVALKILRAESAEGTEGAARLVREARATASLSHPNVLAIYDVGEVQEPATMRGLTYIAMELVVGSSLHARIGDATVPMTKRVAWMCDVARALAAAHEAGIVHRDVKPENVMVRSDDVVKVVDFGIARRTASIELWSSTEGHSIATKKGGDASASLPTLTGQGVIVGTPFYMAPEQLRGEVVDARADQFAWGVVAYLLLTGKPPWPGGAESLAVISQILSFDPPPLTDVEPSVPRNVSDAVMRALSKRREDRFASMTELLTLTRASELPGATIAASTSRPRAASRTVSRARMRYAVAVVVAIGAALLVVWARSPSRRSATPGGPSPSPNPNPGEAGRGVAITDLPLPESARPDAIDAYKAALGAMRASNLRAAEENLRLALARDPELAAAYLRLIPIAMYTSWMTDTTPPYRGALRLRQRLSDRDRGVLDAYAPIMEREPADFGESARRFASLASEHPGDAEILVDLARIEDQRLDLAAARGAVEGALAIDPDYGEALMIKGKLELESGLFDQAAADDDLCFTRFGSVECLGQRGEVAQFTGADDAIALARRRLSIEPDAIDSAMAFAGCLFQGGADAAAVRAAIAEARAALPEASQAFLDGRLAILSGDFVLARKVRLAWRDRATSLRSKQSEIAWTLVELDIEMGDSAMALRDAEEFASALPAFTQGRVSSSVDPIMPVLRVLREQGKLAEGDYARRRGEFIDASLPQVGPDGRPLVWLTAYAEAARTPETAKEALQAARTYGEPAYHEFGGAPVGHVHLLAGDAAGALPDLRRGARSCLVFDNPVATVRAHLDLGEALEATGDAARACEQYAFVLAAWRSATPRSVSAESARQRARALKCAAAR